MKILFATYQMAFHTPGGGEIQLLEYKKALEDRGNDISFFKSRLSRNRKIINIKQLK